jgi:hypothetical protein
MAKADFQYLSINQEFNSQNNSVTKTFTVESSLPVPPIQDGYLLITTRDVTGVNHQVFINNNQLPGFDLRAHEGWATSMDHIPPGLLKAGQNTITIERIGGDDFAVGFVVINWREVG